MDLMQQREIDSGSNATIATENQVSDTERSVAMTIRPLRESRSVFVTGATGLVGSYLIKEMIDRSTATINCLVRPSRLGASAQDRLRKKCAEIGVSAATFEQRVRVWHGAVEKPKLGLSDNDHSRLCDEVDTVFHLAAKLNYLAPLSALYDVNVGGTENVLQLAETGTTKTFHYMSSSGVFMSLDAAELGYLSRCVPLEKYDRHVIGYLHSKWHAEMAARAARARGLSTLVYRPSFIGGSLESGYLPERDVTRQFLAACLEVRAIPQVEFMIDIVPVDILATAVANLAERTEHQMTDVNLCNPHPTNIAALATAFPSFKGRDLETVSYEEWCKYIRRGMPTYAKNLMRWATRPTPEAPEGLLRAFTGVRPADAGLIDMDYALKGSGTECPPVCSKMVTAYASSLI